jgi:hypothetical protein
MVNNGFQLINYPDGVRIPQPTDQHGIMKLFKSERARIITQARSQTDPLSFISVDTNGW